MAFPNMLRIWEEVRIDDSNFDVTGTLLFFVGTLLLSHVFHNIIKAREGKGKRKGKGLIEKLFESSSKKQKKRKKEKNQWEESCLFLPH